jgi:copper resistance protein B
MSTKQYWFVAACLFANPVLAHDGHGAELYHAFTLQADYGEGRDDSTASWDLDGWLGNDDHKLWLKSKGENTAGHTERSETWALYSSTIDTFWDAQAGFRYDNKPESTPYLVLGIKGLAPYYFDTEAHLFVSDEGDTSARLREENDLLLTQQLVLKAYGEINLFAQEVKELQVGSGVSSGEIGLQLRYEITRKFAPYADIRYVQLFGDTASLAQANNERQYDVIAALGLQLIF